MKKTGYSEARTARERLGLTAKDVAKRAGICEEYLVRCERSGAPYFLARKLSAILGVRIDVFIPRKMKGGQ